jgi:fatty-acyl-CoA synthase
MLIGDILRRAADPRRSGRKTAVIFQEKTLTYRQLNEQVNRLANGLLRLGVRVGDRVAVLGRNSDEYVVIYFALAKIGAILVPVNYWYKAGEIDYTLRQSGSAYFLVQDRFAPLAAQAAAPEVRRMPYGAEAAGADTLAALMADSPADEPDIPLSEDDPHIILYTSGTTGFPKGAVLSHKNHVVHALAWVIETRVVPDDVGLIVYPLFHTGGPDCILLPHFLVGATVVVMDRADPPDLLEAVQRHGATNLFCVPTVWRRLLAYPELDRYDVRTINRCLGSSDTFPPDLLQRIKRRFDADVYVTYGLTEAGCILTFSKLTRDGGGKIDSVGRPHPFVDVRVVDEQGRDLPAGAVGEVIARGDPIMAGYWEMPDRTAEALKDGWLHSGDLGRFDEDGYLAIVGRSKDMIISGGENIYPVEIEKLLREHEKIRDAAVIGVPDPEWGESVLAVVVPEPGQTPTPEEVIDFVRTRLAGYKKPRYVEIVDALPVTTATGKVQKAVLRERYREKYRTVRPSS